MIHQRKILKAIAYAILLCFTSLTGAQPLYAIPANTQLPTGPDGTVGKPHDVLGNVITGQNGNTLTITQDGKTSVLKWGDFSIGADAAVNFVGEKGFNSLNYVTGANAPISEIYGQLTALGGNIFIANPAGVQIGNSAQINVGSLYVTNKDVGDAVNYLSKTSEESDIISAINTHGVAETNAELMSLGAIVNAKNVTFDGGRIVLDTDRIYADNAEGELQPVDDESLKGMLDIITTDKDNVVLGYTKDDTAAGFDGFDIKVVDDAGTITEDTLEHGYTWVHDLAELRAMNDDTSGWYALRNSIDANATVNDNFNPIGSGGDAFKGRFDGLGYSIFGLNVNVTNESDAAGLFGFATDAHIKNFTLNGGKISGSKYVGAVAGSAMNSTIENITNTASVSGKGGEGDNGIGGIVGYAGYTTMSGLINIGTITGEEDSVNVGGIVGNMLGGTLTGETYNLGSVTGGWNIGGIAGQMTNDAKIGNDGGDAFQIYNQLNVTGDYNVGGIAGKLSDSTITNAANYGNVTAEGHTTETYQYHKGKAEWIGNVLHVYDNSLETINDVWTANAGGIAGKANDASISNVTNTGDVTTSKTIGNTNTGTYYNAGNVGGIVGRAENTKITNAENKENTVAGAHNVGGVAGFLTGNSTVSIGVNNGGDITATGARTDGGFARETVRGVSSDGNENFIIGNIGGVVGYLFGDDAKIENSGNRGTVHSAEITGNSIPLTAQAANVGGVVGKISSEINGTPEMLQKIKDGEETATVSNSYNTGDVRGYTGIGGVIGQMFNGSVSGSYNLGTLKATRTVDENSRQKESLNMGGIVGDTSEESEARAIIYDVYNAGQIGDENFYFRGRHVGGIAGRLSGFVDKAYNTGDIYNGYSTVGGIAGWWFAGEISNVFNTGNITVKNFDAENKRSQVGGIVGDAGADAESLFYAYNLGTIRSFAQYLYDPKTGENAYSHHVGGIAGRITNNLKIDNVYTLGNLYAASLTAPNSNEYVSTTDTLGAIYGSGGNSNNITNANYITPENPTDVTKPKFEDLREQAKAQGIHVVEYNNKSNAGAYKLNIEKLDTASDWSVDTAVNKWRLYDEGTPILNVFMPSMEATDAWKGQLVQGDSVQYGTAYNPLLTILNLKNPDNVTFKWGDLGLYGAGGLAVYGGGLTIDGFQSAGDGRYFGGTIFSDHALAMNGTGTNFNLGSASKLYGSSVTLTNGGDISAYGEITSMNGDIEITGKNVEIIGSLTAKKKGEKTEIDGISGASRGTMDTTSLNDPNKPMKSVSDMFTYETEEGASRDGDITITASGAAEVLYGNLGTGSVSTAGNFTVNGGTTDGGKTFSGGSVYVDSDLSGTTGDINLSAGGEVLLDITNIAKANSDEQGTYNGWRELHEFLDDHNNNKITLDSKNDDEVLAIDMWNGSEFDLKQYDEKDTDNTFRNAILNLGAPASKTHIWISDANQLKGIQSYAETNGGSGILGYNFALKGNIDASALTGYEEIGGGTTDGYSGTFDGRGFRIIGLNADATKADEASSGIFGKLAGTVKDLRVYASKFFGGDGESAGAIASEVITQTKEDGSTVSGTITGVTTFGNRVEAANAGGIAGTNAGTIESSAASDSVITNGGTAGGIAGTNTGTIGAMEGTFVTAESAVTSDGNATAIGGVVGKNEGKVNLANSLGVTNGEDVDKVGGIAGDNSGAMYSLYNESVVTGNGSVGGVAGTNSGEIENAVNTTGITATGDYAGGLAGVNSGTIDSGRNTGTINGKDYVGGMVGSNGEKGILKNLSNAIVAAITGTDYVGGIAGSNAGSITSDNNLTNEGTVSGTKYVGGIAGENTGTIENVLNETLVLKTGNDVDARYFGGIAGTNSGKITNATNNSNVSADGATFVGGIVGENTLSGELEGKLINYGDVSGESNVGGLAGSNANDDLLKGTENDYITAENHGEVKADAGSAGGIFYENKGDIEYANLTNTGTVIGTGQANTGGLFGINSGNISHSTLTNSGTVEGGTNTGGLIGSNSGNVANSSLINEYDAKVTGGDNTGGLIGYNTGSIEGGRNADDTMYVHKIYNNGTVSGALNVGGLIGTNAEGGVLKAAYNTGTVTGAVYKDDDVTEVDHYTNNVGGIVGTNAGTVSSVFNTIMTATGENQSVTGASNVGGLIGNNTGTLKDAYNTTEVESQGNKGNAVGENSGTVENVYAANTDGKLVGSNNGTVTNSYTFSAEDDETDGVTLISGKSQTMSGSYGGFDFGSTWKNYDSYTTPMLKVFLTQANASSDGVITAADGLNAYNHNNWLIEFDPVLGAVGIMLLYSHQIASSGLDDAFNPNWLGYDFDNNIYIVDMDNYGHLHSDGWDRLRNFRERKAELYFHEGGMEYAEEM